MNILQLISSEGMYGAEAMLLSLTGALTRRGHRVVLAVFEDRRNPHIELASLAEAQGLETRRIPCSGRWDWQAVGAIRALIDECGADLLHAHGYKADLYGYAAASRRGKGLPACRLVSTCHNWPDKRLLMRTYAALDRFVLRKFAAVATPSRQVGRVLTGSGVPAVNVKVIRNGVDVARFAQARPGLREELGRPSDILIGCVSRLVSAKGGHLLLQAARRVLVSHPNASFVFVGSGPAREEWEKLSASLGIADRVVFTGERRDMPGVYASFDVLVLPSLDEAMPMCLLEGLSAKRPVIATSVGEIPELIHDEDTGLLIEPGNVDALANALLRMIDRPARAAEMAAQGQAMVQHNFSADAMARNYEGLYEDVAGSVVARPRLAGKSLDISIIAACRNEARHIRAFLDSIVAQDFGNLTWEAIVADGMSTDGTRDMIDEYAADHSNIRLLENPGRIVSTGLNAAIRASRGKLILRMDAHTRYSSDYCVRCAAASEATNAGNVGGPARTSATGVKARGIAAAYHSRFSTGGARFHDPNYQGWVDTVPYGCWRRETFDQIGLFDEELVRNQDDEFNLRLIRAGGKIWQDPAILSWYSPRAELSALFHQYFQYGFWKVAVIRKHRLPGSWRHLVPVVFVLLNILLPLMVLASATSGSSPALTWSTGMWLAFVSCYAAGNFFASLAAARTAGWKTLPFLPAAFATFHFSYGLGFLAGLLRFGWRPTGPLPANSVFARITR
jgi:glycosyltransferase involved in cell wall biosynthesis